VTTFVLVRHGDTDAVGKRLVGRLAGVVHSALGERQIRATARELAGYGIDRIVAGPLERAQFTAATLAEATGAPVETDPLVDEVAFGSWTGQTFAALDDDPRWARYSAFRGGVRIPGGEMGIEVQARMVAATERLRGAHPHECIAIASHGDPIRYLVAHYAGVPIDLVARIAIDVASVSVLAVDDAGARVLCVNRTGQLPPR
jgi:broad specificity phosphatase PhoE